MTEKIKDAMSVDCEISYDRVSVNVTCAVDRLEGDDLSEAKDAILDIFDRVPAVLITAGKELVRQSIINNQSLEGKGVTEGANDTAKLDSNPEYKSEDCEGPKGCRFFEFLLRLRGINQQYIGKVYPDESVKAWLPSGPQTFTNMKQLEEHFGEPNFSFLFYHGDVA